MSLVKLRTFQSEGVRKKTFTHSFDCTIYSSASSDGLAGLPLAACSQPYILINCYIKYFFIPGFPALIYMCY